jgi:isopenicillin N synthase-like dioxygenase
MHGVDKPIAARRAFGKPRFRAEAAMNEKVADNFTPDRDRVADAGAEVPIIDISDFNSRDPKVRATVVDAVREACERVGFFVITGHGVAEDTIARTFKLTRAFFTRPTDDKQRIKRPGPGISRGYNSLASQALGRTMGTAAPPDLMESLGFGPLEISDGPYWREGYGPIHFHPNLWPDDMPGFREAVSEYWRAMEDVSAQLMRIFALALDLDENYFVSRSDRHVTNMRINYYPVQLDAPQENQLRAGAHSDYGAFTLLRGENAPGGLQVLRRAGDWADVPMVEGGYVVNIGDLLMRWTNDRWVSTIHRVVNPPEEVRRRTDRVSIAFFFVPNHDVKVSCIESCMSADNPPRYVSTTAGGHWRGKILASRQIGKNAPNSDKSQVKS